MNTLTSKKHTGQEVKVRDPNFDRAKHNSDLFIDRLKELLGDESQRSFAQAVGVADGTLRAWLSGKAEPSMQAIIAIASYKNVSIDWLLVGKSSTVKPEGTTEPPNGYNTASLAPSSPDPNDYCYVPLYDVYASAGNGALIDQEQIKSQLAFKQSWFRGEMGLNPKDCCLIYVTGDSMEPTLHKNDVVMLDRSDTTYIEDGVYCLRFDGGLVVKRVQRANATQIKVMSDNPIYEPYIIGITDAEIIGKVVWAGKRF